MWELYLLRRSRATSASLDNSLPMALRKYLLAATRAFFAKFVEVIVAFFFGGGLQCIEIIIIHMARCVWKVVCILLV